MNWKEQSWAFVDIETTGGRPFSSRIIEIAVILVTPGEADRHWQTLIQPETYIPPGITEITGITNHMVQEAPIFTDIAGELFELLKGRIFAAHNVGFDYNFLTAEFKMAGLTYRARKFCTVQLSRKLFPNSRSHSLDNIIQTFNLQCKDRHRAMDDIIATRKFFLLCANRGSDEIFNEAIQKQLKAPKLPKNLSEDQIEPLPETVGIYKFFGKNGNLLYIGKSTNIRKRVLSHFSATPKAKKSNEMLAAISSIEFEETVGEMHALLMEAQCIKEFSPIYNKKLKGNQPYHTFHLKGAKGNQIQLEIRSVEEACTNNLNDCFGIYRNHKAAKKYRDDLVHKHKLCDKLTGIQHTKGACFGYQIQRCEGACIDEVSPAKHYFKMLQILTPFKLLQWPSKDALGFKETNKETGESIIHIVDRWFYLGSIRHLEDSEELLCSEYPPFDYDFYQIFQSFLHKSIQVELIKIKRSRLEQNSDNTHDTLACYESSIDYY